MAFFAHIGDAYSTASNLGYTPLATVTVTGILDTIVADLSAATASGTNNGWSLFDDMRTGSVNPILPYLATFRGIMARPNPGATYPFTFISASITATCNTTYGYNWYYCISNTSSLPTSMSLDGVTWYTGYASAWPTNWVTATLDRPYTGSTVSTTGVFTKINNWIVLKHTGGQKTFYTLMGVPQDRCHSQVVYIQPHEVWDATNHTGATGTWAGRNPPPMEATIIYEAGQLSPATTKCQLMLWFMTDAFVIWTGGIPDQRLYALRSLTYIGNLDTSAVRSSDTDALAFIPGQTMYTGMSQSPTDAPVAISTLGGGAIQCLRNISGDPWSMPTGLHQSSSNYRNEYQLFPRARWYGSVIDAPTTQSNGKFYYTEIDVMQSMGNIGTLLPLYGNSEGRRGKLRYVKCPMNTPSWQHLNTVQGDDGYEYIFVNQSVPFIQGPISTSVWNWFQFDYSTSNSPVAKMTGWCFGMRGASGNATTTVAAYTGEIASLSTLNVSAGYGGFFNYLLLPISGSGI